MFLEEYTT
jgi:hypothetical protein